MFSPAKTFSNQEPKSVSQKLSVVPSETRTNKFAPTHQILRNHSCGTTLPLLPIPCVDHYVN
jgi:hypothetical protein